ncbi:MAG: hypothetical protein Sv326_0149 [Candidatus Fermentimicrarchaeum limneticum]|uniref:Uncharacterized protein n=1 Tax=Fermentimicrarchaeum limneticum TaxID=2795018 RepID=A0A7D6BUG4_FERL1|nr:MAG: hypothetical protein Sv326_0149 [Candidatus Fermentimicrarchaeum limneticum]
MPEYVLWCNSVEDFAGRCPAVAFNTRRYSEITVSRVLDFFLVNSRQFNTMHFLTNSLILLCLQGFKRISQFLPCLKAGVSLRGIL